MFWRLHKSATHTAKFVRDVYILWQGASGNKLFDTFNIGRFTILKSKFIKLKAPNMSIQASGVQTVGIYVEWSPNNVAPYLCVYINKRVFCRICMTARLQKLTEDNKKILKDVPDMFRMRMQECVVESYKYETSSAMYMQTCARLNREIDVLQHTQLVSAAHCVLRRYHESGLSRHCPSRNNTLTTLEVQTTKLHAAKIALFIQQSSRAKEYDQMQIHIHSLQALIQKHNTCLNRLAETLSK